MKIRTNTAILISGYAEPIPSGAVVVAVDTQEAEQLVVQGYVTVVGDDAEVTKDIRPKVPVSEEVVVTTVAAGGKRSGKSSAE